MFNKILIANRGEIVVRIVRTCRTLGIRTVGVFSDADANSGHLEECDEVENIGPAPVNESYLNVGRIIEVAQKHSAQAVHPGYGLFSEQPQAARAIIDAGLAFIGPKPQTLELFGDKWQARRLAKEMGIPTVPGVEFTIEEIEKAISFAEDIGWPIVIKAIAGGGGIGIHAAHDEQELGQAARACADRASRAFGNAGLYIEKLIPQARHIEVQFLCDKKGQITLLGERECSVQRRHQKILEEAPSPFLTQNRHGSTLREAMYDAATQLAQASNYENAGTCEFIVDPFGYFYFLEINARLQVEHPITEFCTDIDLVEWQLRIASDEPLSDAILSRVPAGYAVETRICAEDAERNFLPAPGTIETLVWPVVVPGRARIDTAVRSGSVITPHYDSLIAKMITYGATRHDALLLMDRLLAQTTIAPLKTNIPFLRKVLADASFRAGQYDVGLTARLLANQSK